MMSSRPRVRGPLFRVLAAGVLLIAGSACESPVAPRDVAGVYVAEEWPPELWAESLPDDGFEYQIAADTLVLERNGTGVLHTAWRRRSTTSGDTTTFAHRVQFTFTRAGNRINTVSTGCEGDCSRGPLLPSFDLIGDTLYPTAFRTTPFSRVAAAAGPE